MNPVIVITGPTASGKTGQAVYAAQKLNAEVVSADSMQIYKHMDIGTAKPSKDEMEGVRHHMIDVVTPDKSFNVVMYKEEAERCIKDITDRGRLAIVAGGTGLYINSLIYNIQFSETVRDESFRRKMNKLAAEEGPVTLHEMLKTVDPISAEKIHHNNLKRVIRALEVYEYTGKPISWHKKQSRAVPPRYRYIVFVLNIDRDELYRRIDKRVDQMIEQGLVDEVESLLQAGIKPDSVALQGLGYKEIIAYLKKETTLDEAIRILKRDTRHYAKRQLTWFRSIKGAIWINGGDVNLEKNTKIIHEHLETCI